MRLFCAFLLLLALAGAAMAAPLDLTVEERAWLARHKDSLVLSYDRTFPPIEFEKPDGAFSGLSADLVAHIEERLGITFRKQQSVEGAQRLVEERRRDDGVAQQR